MPGGVATGSLATPRPSATVGDWVADPSPAPRAGVDQEQDSLRNGGGSAAGPGLPERAEDEDDEDDDEDEDDEDDEDDEAWQVSSGEPGDEWGEDASGAPRRQAEGGRDG
ncbi:hypothetical protein AAGT00_03660 [Streptomyces cavourensis]